MLRLKNATIALIYTILVTTNTQHLGAAPTGGVILGDNICLIGDMHTVTKSQTTKAYTSIMDTFMAHERRKPYDTAIILELPPFDYSTDEPITRAHFLMHVAQHKPSSRSNSMVTCIDQRQRTLSAFEGLEAFWQDCLTQGHPFTIKYLKKNKATLLAYYGKYTDALVSDGIDDISRYLEDIHAVIHANFDETTPMYIFLETIYQDLWTVATRAIRFFDFVEDKENTTILEAVFQKTIELKSFNVIKDVVMGVRDGFMDQLTLHVFNMCAALEICKNLQNGNRVVLITGTVHAFYLIHYLKKHLSLPTTQMDGFYATYDSRLHPQEANPFLCELLPPERFARLLNTFYTLPQTR